MLLGGGAVHAAGATALYYGGYVTQNAKVYVVWWGDPTKINPALTATKGGIADFFAGITDSSYMDWLNEYNTAVNAQAGSHMGMAGTGQRIGRGNYAGTFTLANIPTGNVTDAQIQSTIDAAIAAGTLPAPDDNSLYALYFPSSVSINLDGSTSCSGYGAYHDAIIETQRHDVYYMVMPDCGSSFNGFTSVTSHELIEAITDNVPTAGSMPDYPQAWNDSMGDEMADLCEGGNSSATVSTGLGTFTVQNIWDERTQGCTAFSSDANDFNVAMSPNVATVALSATTTFTVKSATSVGSPQMLTLSVTAPAGVTATVSPTTITSGATAALTVTVTSAAPPTGLQIVVRADAGAGSAVQTHTAALLLTTTAAPPDLGTPPDLAGPATAGDAGSSDDMGTGTGGDGVPPSTMPKGCNCAIGATADASGRDGAWAEGALLLLALLGMGWRRRQPRSPISSSRAS
ncbi:MAG TPA: hypothetical protein VGL86_15925 [Polyangia bacterium]